MRVPQIVLGGIFAISFAAALVLVEMHSLSIRIDLDPSSEPLLATDDPEFERYRRAVLDFGNDEIFVIAMETEDVFTHENLSTLRRLSRKIGALPGVRRAESLTNVTVIRNDAERDQLTVRPLIGEIPRSVSALRELRELALADPLLRSTLISADGRVAAIDVRLTPATALERIRQGIDREIVAVVAAEAASGQRFYVAGRPHIAAAAHRGMVSDTKRLIPYAFAAMVLVLWAFTGSARGVWIPLGTVSIAMLWTLAAVAFFGGSLNLITVVLPPILIGIGSVYGVHILAHYESVVRQTHDSRDAARRLYEATRLPVWIAGTSTIASFGALGLADVPATRQLGAYAALAVTAVMLLSLIGVPALVAVLPVRDRTLSPRARALGQALDRRLERVARFATRRATFVIAAFSALCLFAGTSLFRISVDTDMLTFFYEDSPLRRDFRAVNRLLAGAIPLYVVVSGDGGGTFQKPRNLRTLERLEAKFDAIPGVSHSVSMADLVKVVNRAVRNGDPDAERIPDTVGGVAELLLVVPKGKLKPLANVDQSRANLIVRTGEQGSAAIRSLVAQLSEAIAAQVRPPLRATITGDTILLNRSSDRLATSQVRTVGAAAVAIFLIVAVVFRSLPLAFTALIPNVVPVLLFYGALGVGLAPLSLPTSLIGCIALGIAVDDTVHFLARYRTERRAGQSPEAAVMSCVKRVGRPIAITSLMLFLAFWVVALSDFATFREFGALIGLTIAICLATDLLLLPAILVRFRVA